MQHQSVVGIGACDARFRNMICAGRDAEGMMLPCRILDLCCADHCVILMTLCFVKFYL